MVSFIDTPRFPDTVAEGATGGPAFQTTVFETHTGLEQRNIMWRLPRHKYNVALGIRDGDDMDDVREFFYKLRGRHVGFRFKDWNDYEIVDGNIGTGNGTTTVFNIVKKYTHGAETFERRIYKPVASTLIVKVNGVTQTLTTDYTVNANTGVITFVVAPTNTHPVTVTCEFDVPVRLDIDEMMASHVGYNVEDWQSIPLIELLYDTAQFAAAT